MIAVLLNNALVLHNMTFARLISLLQYGLIEFRLMEGIFLWDEAQKQIIMLIIINYCVTQFANINLSALGIGVNCPI